jgi:hypothetical protein
MDHGVLEENGFPMGCVSARPHRNEHVRNQSNDGEMKNIEHRTSNIEL